MTKFNFGQRGTFVSREILPVNSFSSSMCKPKYLSVKILLLLFFHFTEEKFVYQLFVKNHINSKEEKTIGTKLTS